MPVGPHALTLPGAIAMWMAMMSVMMLPAVLPWFQIYGKLAAPTVSRAGMPHLVPLFATGYLGAWLFYSVIGAFLQVWLQAHTLLTWDLRVGTMVGAIVLVGAGLYQWTPLKAACLRHCRNPLTYFLTRWRNGPRGAWKMGLDHGIHCVGCCWALMALGFVLGLMNLLWMAGLTALVAVEQVAPRGKEVGRAVGVVLVLWGVAALLAGS